MKSYHQNTSSMELFSFPSTPSPDHQHNSEFEFGCVTPDSPTLDPSKNSPADHIFSNGRLMPHSFPTPPPPPPQQQKQQQPNPISALENAPRIASRTSSVSSKDSLVSSRSNSTNSSRSSISSGRTSWSSGDQNNSLENNSKRLYNKVGAKAPNAASKIVMAQIYGSSQRWQHIVPVPGLKRDDSRKSNSRKSAIDESLSLDGKKKQLEKVKREEEGGILWRFFRWFLVACGKCHSMERSNKMEMLNDV